MIEPAPPRSGEPLRASWAQRLISYVRSLRVFAGPGLVARRTPSGTVVSLAQPARPAPSGNGGTVPAVVRGCSAGVYTVDLHADGILRPRTGTARLVLTEVSPLAPLPNGTVLLAHTIRAALAASGTENGG